MITEFHSACSQCQSFAASFRLSVIVQVAVDFESNYAHIRNAHWIKTLWTCVRKGWKLLEPPNHATNVEYMITCDQLHLIIAIFQTFITNTAITVHLVCSIYLLVTRREKNNDHIKFIDFFLSKFSLEIDFDLYIVYLL